MSRDSRVRAFVEGSSGAHASFFAQLDPAAWLCELARGHLRALTDAKALDHASYAAWLGLTGPYLDKIYRQLVRRDDEPRAALVEFARRALFCATNEDAALLPRTAQAVNLRRAIEAAKREKQRFGAVRAELPTYGELGRSLEECRVLCAMPVDAWAKKLGISRRTYETYLAREDETKYRLKLAPYAGAGKRLAEARAVPPERVPVSAAELGEAYDLVAEDLRALRERLLRESAEREVAAPEKPDPTPNGFLKLDLYSWLKEGRDEESE